MIKQSRFPSQLADKFVIRFDSEQTRSMLKARAAINRRSMNSEILSLIESGLKAEQAKENAPETAISDALNANTQMTKSRNCNGQS